MFKLTHHTRAVGSTYENMVTPNQLKTDLGIDPAIFENLNVESVTVRIADADNPRAITVERLDF